MEIKQREKTFKRGKLKTKTSLMINTPIVEALEYLSHRSGESVGEIVADVLDQYLTEMQKQGYLPKAEEIEKFIELSKKAEDAG